MQPQVKASSGKIYPPGSHTRPSVCRGARPRSSYNRTTATTSLLLVRLLVLLLLSPLLLPLSLVAIRGGPHGFASLALREGCFSYLALTFRAGSVISCRGSTSNYRPFFKCPELPQVCRQWVSSKGVRVCFKKALEGLIRPYESLALKVFIRPLGAS